MIADLAVVTLSHRQTRYGLRLKYASSARRSSEEIAISSSALGCVLLDLFDLRGAFDGNDAVSRSPSDWASIASSGLAPFAARGAADDEEVLQAALCAKEDGADCWREGVWLTPWTADEEVFRGSGARCGMEALLLNGSRANELGLLDARARPVEISSAAASASAT